MTSEPNRIVGVAAPLPIDNLDTDQIMPKQFLRGIDKSGLAQGVLYDLRTDTAGNPRPDFILNQDGWRDAKILVAGPNFGCGSSREHAVWGLQQFGIRAVIAPGFGEIFYGNALNNSLLPVVITATEGRELMDSLLSVNHPVSIDIDIEDMVVHGPTGVLRFSLPERYHRMFLAGLDIIGASLQHREEIEAFATARWAAEPWVKDVAIRTRALLDATPIN